MLAPRPALAARLLPLGLLINLLWAGAAPAQEDRAEASQAPAVLAPVVVTATRTTRAGQDVAAAVDTVNAATVRAMGPHVNLSESLQRVPGITALNRQNYAQDLQISSRGFGARSTFGVRGIRLYADGIPGTMPDGSGQSALFDLGSARRIEVLRGPASALYGNAAGGVVQVFTEDGPPRPELSTSVAVSRDGFHREQLKFGGETGRLNYVVNASHFETDGWRDHSAAQRRQFNTKLRWRLEGDASLSLIGSHLDMPGVQDPLGLTREQWRASPTAVAPVALSFDTRKDIENGQLGLVYERPVGDDSLRLMAYDGQRKVRQFQAIPTSAQTNRHPGGVIDFERQYWGLDGRYTWRTELAARPLSVVGGVSLDHMDEARKGFQNFVGSQLGVLGALRRDEDNKARNNDQYLQAEWSPAPAWQLSAGVRHSRVRFESEDHYITPDNGDDSGGLGFEATTPTASVMWKAGKAWHLYATAGRSFETPTLAEVAYRTNSGTETGWNTALKPSKAEHLELGLKSEPAPGLQWTAAAFQVRTDDELAVANNSGGRTTYQNVGRTLRRGLESSASWAAPWPGVSVYGALTWLDAHFQDSFVSLGSTGSQRVKAGNKLPGIPARQLFMEVAWRVKDTGWQTALEMRHTGRLWVNDVNDEYAPAATVWAVRAGWQTAWGDEAGQATWRWNVLGRLDNLLDKRYAGSVIVNEGNRRYYEPAPGRSLTLMTTLTRAF